MGHYGRVQQRGTKETNNGLMKGDGVAKSMRTGGQPRGRGQLPNMQLSESEARRQWINMSKVVHDWKTRNPA